MMVTDIFSIRSLWSSDSFNVRRDGEDERVALKANIKTEMPLDDQPFLFCQTSSIKTLRELPGGQRHTSHSSVSQTLNISVMCCSSDVRTWRANAAGGFSHHGTLFPVVSVTMCCPVLMMFSQFLLTFGETERKWLQ